MITLKYILFFFILLIGFNASYAQKLDSTSTAKASKKFLEYYIGDYKFKERNNWFLFGFGPTLYPNIPKINNANFSIDYHFFDKKDRLWSAGYSAISQEYIAFGGGTIYLHELKFSRGIHRVEKQYWKFASFIGPSLNYTSYYPTDTTKSIKGTKTYGVGIQAQTEIIFKPVYDFGISMSPFVNINTVQSVAGITISIYSSNALVKNLSKSKQRQ